MTGPSQATNSCNSKDFMKKYNKEIIFPADAKYSLKYFSMDFENEIEIKVELEEYKCCDVTIEPNDYRFEHDQEVNPYVKIENGVESDFQPNVSVKIEPTPISNTVPTKVSIEDKPKLQITRVKSEETLIQAHTSKPRKRIKKVEIEIDPFADINDEFVVHEAATPKEVVEEQNGWKSYPWTCSLCKRWPFCGYEQLHDHVQSEHSDIINKYKMPYYCYDCKKSIPCYSIFLNHIRVLHHEDWKMLCDICDASFDDYEGLAIHRINHLNTTVHPEIHFCFKCGRVYATQDDLYDHFRLSHNYACKICKGMFATREEVQNHMQEHFHVDSNNKMVPIKVSKFEFKCESCSKSFITEYSLQAHQNYFCKFKSKPLNCKYCKDRFKTFRRLKEHEKDLIRFKCSRCDKEFHGKPETKTLQRKHLKSGAENRKGKRKAKLTKTV